MLPVGFEPTISAGERPQTYALDRAATGTGLLESLLFANFGQNTGYTDFVVDVLIPSRQTPGKIRIRTRLISSKYFSSLSSIAHTFLYAVALRYRQRLRQTSLGSYSSLQLYANNLFSTLLKNTNFSLRSSES